MKKILKTIKLPLVVVAVFIFSACDKDDGGQTPSTISVNAAQNVASTTATLSAVINLSTNELYKSDFGFLYVSDEILYSSAPIDTVNYKQATFDIYCSANKTSSTHADFISDVHTKGTLIDDAYEEHTLESEVKY